MKYLVTGGAGFIGSSIVSALVDQGKHVRVADNFSTGRRDNLAMVRDSIEIVEGDLAELNIIDPNLEWIFKEENIQSKSHNTPILGMKLKGKVLITINKGFISNCKLS